MIFLSQYFRAVAAKTLSSVEINKWRSNQHEFHGVASLKHIFGYSRQYFNAVFFYFGDNGNVVKNNGRLTWYDAREYSFDRTEYRLYYTESNAINYAQPQDLMVVGVRTDGSVYVMIAQKGTVFYKKLKVVFGLATLSERYTLVENLQDEDYKIDEDVMEVLKEIGIYE